MDELNSLIERIEKAPEITCPLCGKTGFDIHGYLYSHRNGRYCDVERVIRESGVEEYSNQKIAAALRARKEAQ